MVLMWALVSSASAQTISFRTPTIVAFAATLPSVSLSAIERGEAEVTLVWRIDDYDEILRVGLDQLARGQWQSVLAEEETLFGEGARTFAVAPSGDFAPPTYRLSVSSASGELLTQQIVVIPFQPETTTPTIELFETDTTGLDSAALLQRNAIASLRYVIEGRTPTSHLRFEQVLSEQDVIRVEVPRESLWLPSQGEVQVAPDVPLTEIVVRLRATLYDIIDGEVFDTAELTLPLTGAPLNIPGLNATPTIAPTAAPSVTPASATVIPDAGASGAATPTPDQAVSPGVRIVSFNALPAQARPGESLIVSWNVENASNISVQEQYSNGAAGLLYIELPPTGALSLRMPEGGVNVTYTLRARAADGTEVSATVTVTSQG
jgi:hypothetical protein